MTRLRMCCPTIRSQRSKGRNTLISWLVLRCVTTFISRYGALMAYQRGASSDLSKIIYLFIFININFRKRHNFSSLLHYITILVSRRYTSTIFQRQVFSFRSYLQTFLKEYPYQVAKLRFFSDLNKFFGLFFFFNNWFSVGGLFGPPHKTNWRQQPPIVGDMQSGIKPTSFFKNICEFILLVQLLLLSLLPYSIKR